MRGNCRDVTRGPAQGGFTLVELMISLTVVSTAIAAAFAMAFSLMRGFQGNQEAMKVESTSRTVLDVIASGIRSASPGLSGGVVWDPCVGADIETIQVTNNAGPNTDELEVVHALGGALASLTASQNILTAGLITVDDNSTFEKDIWLPAIVIDPLNGKGHLIEVRNTGTVTELESRGAQACPVTVGAESYNAGSFVVRAVRMKYAVSPGAHFLMVDPDGAGPDQAEVIMAEGIEDMQIAVAVEDGVNPDTIDDVGLAAGDDEWIFNVAGEVLPSTVAGGQWRALRITVTGYALREQNNATDQLRPAAEDRPIAVTGDGFRRRTFSTTVNLRNLAD